MTYAPTRPAGVLAEGLVEIDGEGFYAIPDVDRLPPFLMSVLSPSDHWMFVSSLGPLTAGRRDADHALFPYETDDRLHRACGTNGPVTVVRVGTGPDVTRWEPFRGPVPDGARRSLYKSVVGNQVVFEEAHDGLGLVFSWRWATSDRFGFVRTATLACTGDRPVRAAVLDGLVDVLPYGVTPDLHRRQSNLTNAYKRNELIDPATRLAVFSLESHIVDRAEPAEALQASVVWSDGWDATVCLDPAALAAFRDGRAVEAAPLVTGRAGAYLLAGTVEVDVGERVSWSIVGDVDCSQADVAALRRELRAGPDVEASMGRSTERLVALLASSDAQQRTGDRIATAHQFANVAYNVMRGGVFAHGYQLATQDYAAFLAARNRAVVDRHAGWLSELPEHVERRDLLRSAVEGGDPHLVRLTLEYLPLIFGRRHGDPSRPWNAFSIRTHDTEGRPVVWYEGNWRDIFQNWEALALAFPEYLPSFVAAFVNASTLDGHNPYRINRDGIDWEIPEPDDPWSNIGYWGDHQIVYLLRLLDATRRYLPGELEALLGKRWFSYADVPYRIAPYEELVREPKATIEYDESAAARSAARAAEIGGDGKLVPGPDGEVYLVTLVEKLLVAALAKLSNYVPGAGIWMNTQRPEWNDANNALVGHGVSMVTLCHLRPYLQRLAGLAAGAGGDVIELSSEVAGWLAAVTGAMREHASLIGGELTGAGRRRLMDDLGEAFTAYRLAVYGTGFSGSVEVAAGDVADLCVVALAHLDDAIARNRRPDGLYHSYNLVDLGDGTAAVLRLPEMLEGQVAVLSSGLLGPDAAADLVDALFASALYRADQRSFMLYPVRTLPPFLDKNVVPAELVAANPLLVALLAGGDRSVVEVDVDGVHRFNASFRNTGDLEAALDRLAGDERWRRLVSEQRAAVLDAYEEVVQHRRFTGRSGSMYAYEGLGSVYWHMVGKLLVAVQEALLAAHDDGAGDAAVTRLRDAYWAIRGGLGLNKTALEYGAFPTDPYSHTPAHTGAQQPGMTGQVKEELLARLLETGVRVVDGAIVFDPVSLRAEELLVGPEAWEVIGIDGGRATVEVPAQSLGLTVCQVPVIVTARAGKPEIEVTRADGSRHRVPGAALDAETSRAIFGRSGQIARLHAFVPLGPDPVSTQDGSQPARTSLDP